MAPRPHRQSCRECKRAFVRLLKAAVGEVRQQYDLRLPARLTDLRRYPAYETLASIYTALQRHRGFDEFVGRQSLRPVDYFLPARQVVIEFDETQHFTAPRRLTLALYPVEVPLGFDRERWMTLCEKLDRHDNSPPYRDEQRAWLDVLRDFAPVLSGNRPTVRVYAGDNLWCTLNPASREVVRAFKHRYLAGL